MVSFCPLSSSGPVGSESRSHGVLACGQVAVYSHLSMGPQGSNHCCVVVHQCFIRDQPDTTEISQIQLAPAVTLHGGRLGGNWGPTACRHSESPETQIPSMQLRGFSFLIDDNQQTDSKDAEKKNEKCSEIAAVTMAKTVNSVIHCNTNHHVTTFPFLIL